MQRHKRSFAMLPNMWLAQGLPLFRLWRGQPRADRCAEEELVEYPGFVRLGVSRSCPAGGTFTGKTEGMLCSLPLPPFSLSSSLSLCPVPSFSFQITISLSLCGSGLAKTSGKSRWHPIQRGALLAKKLAQREHASYFRCNTCRSSYTAHRLPPVLIGSQGAGRKDRRARAAPEALRDDRQPVGGVRRGQAAARQGRRRGAEGAGRGGHQGEGGPRQGDRESFRSFVAHGRVPRSWARSMVVVTDCSGDVSTPIAACWPPPSSQLVAYGKSGGGWKGSSVLRLEKKIRKNIKKSLLDR